MNRAGRRLIAALLLGVVVYAGAVIYSGYREIGRSLSSFAWSAFGAAVLLATANYLLRYLKWEYYLGRLSIRGVGKVDSLLIFLSGFVLTITPGKVGEVFKSAVLKQTHGVPVAKTAPIVVAERLTDVIGVVLLIIFGSTGFSFGLVWAGAGSILVVLTLLAILYDRPVWALLDWAEGHRSLSRFVPNVREAFRSLQTLASPVALLWPILLSIVAWGCEGVALYVLLRGFNIAAPLALSVFFYSTASLAGALIPVPGGLGVVEAMIREQLVHVGGVPQAAATASMILVRFATLWWAVIVGFGALGLLRSRHPVLRGVAPGETASTVERA